MAKEDKSRNRRPFFLTCHSPAVLYHANPKLSCMAKEDESRNRRLFLLTCHSPAVLCAMQTAVLPLSCARTKWNMLALSLILSPKGANIKMNCSHTTPHKRALLFSVLAHTSHTTEDTGNLSYYLPSSLYHSHIMSIIPFNFLSLLVSLDNNSFFFFV